MKRRPLKDPRRVIISSVRKSHGFLLDLVEMTRHRRLPQNSWLEKAVRTLRKPSEVGWGHQELYNGKHEHWRGEAYYGAGGSFSIWGHFYCFRGRAFPTSCLGEALTFPCFPNRNNNNTSQRERLYHVPDTFLHGEVSPLMLLVILK